MTQVVEILFFLFSKKENSKMRNSKQIQITKIQMIKTEKSGSGHQGIRRKRTGLSGNQEEIFLLL